MVKHQTSCDITEKGYLVKTTTEKAPRRAEDQDVLTDEDSKSRMAA